MNDDRIHTALREMLDFDASTGEITWLKNCGRAIAGDEAGSVDRKGYRRVTINGKRFFSHRIAWFLHYGEWPAGEIDHVNGTRDDNRISNLRVVTRAENCLNRSTHSRSATGFTGVHPRPSGRYWAEVTIGGRKDYLGTFNTAEEAHAAYVAAAAKHFGKFARSE